MRNRAAFTETLRHLINFHSMENGSNTPDFMIAEYLTDCLENFNNTLQKREKWYGREAQEINSIEDSYNRE